jgi:ferredoxin
VNFFNAAERLAAIDRSQVVLETERCLHVLDQFSTCEACFNLCPVEAIQPGKPPRLKTDLCVNCLACLPACPEGAYRADDAVPPLLQCLAHLEGSVELVCEIFPEPETGMAKNAVKIRGCLAGLGAAGYLLALALGKSHLLARLDACTTCELSGLSDLARHRVEEARRLLALRGLADRLTAVESLEDVALVERPLWDAENPPLSRRDLFRVVSRQGQMAAARAMLQDGVEPGKHTTRERRRILAAFNRLPAAEAETPVAAVLIPAGAEFGWVQVNADCTACGVCARACPAGALWLEEGEEETFRLLFEPRLCTACGVCTHVCAPGALTLSAPESLAQVFGIAEPLTLFSGTYRRCTRCKTRFTAREGVTLCPVCTFRRATPFAAALPPGLRPAEKMVNNDDH